MPSRAPHHRFAAAVVLKEQPLAMVKVAVIERGEAQFPDWHFEWFACGHGTLTQSGRAKNDARWCRLCSSAERAR